LSVASEEVLLFYWVIFGLVAILVTLELPLQKIGFKGFGIAAAVLFWILSFCRWNCGTDWDTYYSIFVDYAHRGRLVFGGMEPGYLLLSWAFSAFKSYHLFLAALGAVIFSLNCSTIYRQSPLPALSFLILLATSGGDIFFVRQSVAIAICFFSTRYLLEDRWRPFFLSVVIAMLFHYSAVIFLIALFVRRSGERNVLKDLTWIAAASVIIGIASQYLLAFLSQRFFAAGYIMARLLDYGVDNSAFSEAVTPLRLILKVSDKLVLFSFIAWRASKVPPEQTKLYDLFTNLYIVGILILTVFSFVALQFARFSTYFIILETVLLPIAFLTFKRTWQPAILVLVFAYLSLRYYQYFLPFYDLIVPYNFWD
jgi:EpsG family